MKIRVERGRFRVSPVPSSETVLQRLAANIGSLSLSEDGLSCSFSTQNLKKLQAEGLSLHDDAKDAVQKLLVNEARYHAGSQRAALAKHEALSLPDYAFKVPPFAHQKKGWQFLHALEEAALFGDCGIGKTFLVLTFADSLIKWGQKWVFLVVCPVNLIQHVWFEDAAKFSGLSLVNLREESARLSAKDWPEGQDRTDPSVKARARLAMKARHAGQLKARFAQDADMYVVNPENIRGAKEKRVLDLCRRKVREGYQVCLVIDESSKLKNRVSATYKSLKKIRELCSRCIIMTGTPSPNGILDLWAQFSVLDGGQTLHPSFLDYRAEVATEVALRGISYIGKGGKSIPVTKWKPRPGAAKQVYKTIEPRMIRFRTEDCVDLPERRFVIRNVEMTAEQAEIYDDMESRLFAELEGSPITAKVAAVKLLKLREVTGGFIITDQGQERQIGKTVPKMLELDELLEQSIADRIGDDGPPSKALIWAQYQWECKQLLARYGKLYGAKGLFGGISTKAKEDAVRAFKNDPSCRVLVCHPASAGHGLTLIEANYAFYYSMSYNFEEFYQSYRRMTRPGQKRAMTYYFLVTPDTIDEDLLDAIKEKKSLSDLITDGPFHRSALTGKRGGPFTMEVNTEVDTAERGDPGQGLAKPAGGGQLQLGDL
jgi:SNF2 family DNA or RNA helicase